MMSWKCPNCPPHFKSIDERGVCRVCGYQVPHFEDVGGPPPAQKQVKLRPVDNIVERESHGGCIE